MASSPTTPAPATTTPEPRAPTPTPPAPTPSPTAPPPSPPSTSSTPPRPAAPVITTARVAIEALDVDGSLTANQVRRVTERIAPALAACYGPAATRAATSPATSVDVRLVLDEDGRARDVSATGGALPGLAACVAGVVKGARSTVPPDVGTVRVRFTVAFRPESR